MGHSSLASNMIKQDIHLIKYDCKSSFTLENVSVKYFHKVIILNHKYMYV